MSGNPKNFKTQLSLCLRTPLVSSSWWHETLTRILGWRFANRKCPEFSQGNSIRFQEETTALPETILRWTVDGLPTGRCNAGFQSQRIFTRYLMLQLVSWSGALRDSSHIIHTIRNTRNIRNTTLWFGTGQTGAPNEILSMGPRVRRDATVQDAVIIMTSW